jgi:GAF domain-containing protein
MPPRGLDDHAAPKQAVGLAPAQGSAITNFQGIRMLDDFATEVAREGDSEELRRVLQEVAVLTGMGFVAVARVTDTRWVACQVLDRIDFGMSPGEELKISTTICDDIRQYGEAVVIDDVSENADWLMHPAPILYGFKSYASFPIILADGAFYGTLCAIDPDRRELSSASTVTAMRAFAERAGIILSRQ